MVLLRSYWLPLLLALLVHIAAGAMVLRGWTPTAKVAQVIKPQVVNASLIVVQPSRKTVAKPPPPKTAPAADRVQKIIPPPKQEQQPSAAEEAKDALDRERAAAVELVTLCSLAVRSQ